MTKKRWTRTLAAGAAGVLAAVLPTPADAPATAAPAATQVEWWLTDPGCNDWCRWRFVSLQAEQRGDLLTAVWAAALAYDVPEWANWMWVTIGCETGGTYAADAWSGYYQGWTQTDPQYWEARSAAAGLPGASPYSRVDSAMVMAWMMRAGYSWRHWPVCGANSWRPA